MPNDGAANAQKNAPLIVAEEEEFEIEHHPEDWLAFAVFWVLGFIVFLQFFTRYVLNDSLAWTEEIARYGLIWVTYIGAIMVTRRHTHIAVVLLPNLCRRGPVACCWLLSISSCWPSWGCSPISRSSSSIACRCSA